MIAKAEAQALKQAERFARQYGGQLQEAVQALKQVVTPRQLEQVREGLRHLQDPLLRAQIELSEGVARFMRRQAMMRHAASGPISSLVRVHVELARQWPDQEEYMTLHPWYWVSWLPALSRQELRAEGTPEKLIAQMLEWVRGGELVQSLKKSAPFGPRIGIIEDAFWAHCQEKYTLSVPALMPQVEGSIRALGVRVGVRSTGKPYKKVREVIKEITKKPFRGLYWFSSAPLTTFLRERFIDRRNDVLHGEDFSYGTDEELSATCLLALEEVQLTWEKLEKELAECPREEARIAVESLRPVLERLADK